jgi:hypothetical protein
MTSKMWWRHSGPDVQNGSPFHSTSLRAWSVGWKLLQSSTWWAFSCEASVKVKVGGILWTQTTCVAWVIFIRIPYTWLHIIQLWKLINGSGYLILICKYFYCNWDYSWEIKWWVIEKKDGEKKWKYNSFTTSWCDEIVETVICRDGFRIDFSSQIRCRLCFFGDW